MALDYSTFSVVDGSTPSNGPVPYEGASEDQVNDIYGKLPRLSDQQGAKFSNYRDVQKTEIIGSAFHKSVGQGFLSGGRLTKTAALVTSLEVDSRFTSGGVLVRLTSALSYTEYVEGTNYVWISLRRTPAAFSISDGNQIDTYVVRLERTGTSTPPSGTHSLVGIVTVTAGDITAIDDCPSGKYLCQVTETERPFYLSQDVAGSSDVDLRDGGGDDGLSQVINLTGVLTGNINLIVPLIAGLSWQFRNSTSGAFTVTVKGATGTGVVVTQGATARLFTDGTNVYPALTDFSTIGTISADYVAVEVPRWVEVTKTHTNFQTAGLTNDIEIYSLPAGYVLHGVKIKHSASFTGGAIGSYTISVGITGEFDRYVDPFDVFQAPGNTVMETVNMLFSENQGAATSIRAQATSTGANLDQSSAGSVTFWLLVSRAN